MTHAREILAGHASVVAPLLLGGLVTSDLGDARVVIRLTEVEAYGGVGEDPGSHAFRRQTPRNASMFGAPGRAYVYLVYGMHWAVNVVTGSEGSAGAVLLRAGEVVEGLEVARERRGERVRDRDLARGPARLAVALGVNGDVDGINLLLRTARLRLTMPAEQASAITTGPRTGVSGAGADTPWRFHLPEEPSVSPYRRATG